MNIYIPQEESGYLDINSVYGSVRSAQDSDNVMIIQDQELMAHEGSGAPQNPIKFLQVSIKSNM